MTKRGIRALTLATAVAAGAFSFAAPAAAAPAAAAAQPTAAVADAQGYCPFGSDAIAKENIKIRTAPRVDATALGLVLRNQHFTCHRGLDGERYTLCSQTSKVWQYITYNGMTGYIPSSCTRPSQ
ncbi:hypothetical protein ACGF0J_27325 [Nonomuraea sp. NPDC047897]|uniref:hypothetical protein n=1 Tax=Nonomuraea sp. NPDC047897 TaxID=3364346 RepID=UPI00371FA917